MLSSFKSISLRSLAAAALWGALGGAAMAQTISDVPLAVKNNVPPNMMFMLDNSGSMSNIVVDSPYRASATYLDASACTSAEMIPAGTSVDIRIDAGVPYIRYSGLNFVHTTSTASGTKRCFNNAATYGARLLANNSGSPGSYLDADYTGHYLNWYFGSYDNHPMSGWTDRKLVATGSVQTRMEIARTSAKTVLDGLPLVVSGTTNTAVRVGLSTYNNGNGGRLLSGMSDFDAAKRTSVKTSIDSLAPSGNTPLAETLADIGAYMANGYAGNVTAGSVSGVSIASFLQQDGRSSCLSGATCSTTSDANAAPGVGTPTRPVQYWCQKSYVFMMTDGRPQGDQAFSANSYLRDYDGDCSGANAANCSGSWDRKTGRTYESEGSDYLDDIAKALYDVDLRPNLPGAIDSRTGLTKAKKNNLTTYMIGFADSTVTSDPLVMNAALQGGGKFLSATDGAQLVTSFKSALTDAFGKDAASSAVAVANAKITDNNIGYASSYNSGTWYGDLEAYSLDTTTGLQVGASAWSAREKLNAQTPSSRKIATFNGTSGVAFTSAIAGTPSTLTDGVIDYLRGNRAGEGTTYRTRQHLLGDIINAEPVVVTYADGMSVVFQAANDGMLHAIDGRVDASATTRGQELWAYVPRLVHGSLHQLADPAYSHKYFVDGTPATAQVTGAGSMTRLLVGGLGKGGRGYYGLDISTHAAATESAVASKVKWEFNPTNMGYSFGTPLIVKTAAGWRVVVASGYDNGSNLGGDGVGYVWVLDPSSGAVEKTFTTGVGSASDPSGLAHLARQANQPADAVVRFVYGGDLKGNVWRIDLDAPAPPASTAILATRIAALADALGAYQPVTSPAEVGPVTGSTTKLFIYVGTGRYLAEADVPGNTGTNSWATQTQTMYGIIDDTSVASPSLPSPMRHSLATCPTGGGTGTFVCQSTTHNTTNNTYTNSTNAVDVNTKRGWYFDLPIVNGRVLGKPALTTGGTLAFTVNVPTNVTCDPGGSSWFFALSGATGGAVLKVANGAETYVSGTSLGNALASRAVIVTTSGSSSANSSNKRALIRMSDQTVENPAVYETAGVATPWNRIYWRKLN
jgi:type IV pilus assembly protein PilY1